jgi:hypothetical protein
VKSLLLALALLLLATTSAQAQVYNPRSLILPPEEYDYPYMGHPLSGVIRTLSRHRRTTECDPEPTFAGSKSRSAAIPVCYP